MTNLRTGPSSSGCGYVGNWDVCSYPHIHQPNGHGDIFIEHLRVTLSLNSNIN